MNIPMQYMQPEGEFSIPGTRFTVNEDVVRRAIRRLPMRERSEVFDCFAREVAPSEQVAKALRRVIVELAEERTERNTPKGHPAPT